MNILVLCTGNSARSILLEGLLTHLRFAAYSAGSNPAGAVHPWSLPTLARHGITLANPSTKSWDMFAQPDAPVMDLVVTVCGNAAGETCPVWPGAPLRAHWGVDDPAAAAPDQQEAAFETAFQALKRRAEAFAKLPAEHRTAPALAEIGQMA